MFDQGNTWKSICGSEIEKKQSYIYLKTHKKFILSQDPSKVF